MNDEEPVKKGIPYSSNVKRRNYVLGDEELMAKKTLIPLGCTGLLRDAKDKILLGLFGYLILPEYMQHPRCLGQKSVDAIEDEL